MVLGCSLCNQPLVIRSSNIGHQDPSSLMKKLRPPKETDFNDNSSNKASVDLNDAEIVATRCGHMFHKDCLKMYLHRASMSNAKPHGCPMCHKPVIQSQLWPIIIRATREELKQIEKIKSLKKKNTELVTAIKEIRNNTHEQNSALQDARKKMFDYRVQLQGMDMETLSRGNLEKLEKQQADLEQELAAVNEQNLALTSLVERESVYGQQIRSSQNNDNNANARDTDPFTRIVKQLESSSLRKQGLAEKSTKSVLETIRKIENPPMIVPNVLERWRQMKSSLIQNGQENDGGRQFFVVKKQDLSLNLFEDTRDSGRSWSRGKPPSTPALLPHPTHPAKIADKEANCGSWKIKSGANGETHNKTQLICFPQNRGFCHQIIQTVVSRSK